MQVYILTATTGRTQVVTRVIRVMCVIVVQVVCGGDDDDDDDNDDDDDDDDDADGRPT